MAFQQWGCDHTKRGLVDTAIPLDPVVAWTAPGFDFGAPVYVFGDYVVTVTGTNAVGAARITCYSAATGVQRWSVDLPNDSGRDCGQDDPVGVGLRSWVGGVNSVVAVCGRPRDDFLSKQSKLYGISLSTGALTWTSAGYFNWGFRITPSMTILPDGGIIATHCAAQYKINGSTGATIWVSPGSHVSSALFAGPGFDTAATQFFFPDYLGNYPATYGLTARSATDGVGTVQASLSPDGTVGEVVMVDIERHTIFFSAYSGASNQVLNYAYNFVGGVFAPSMEPRWGFVGPFVPNGVRNAFLADGRIWGLDIDPSTGITNLKLLDPLVGDANITGTIPLVGSSSDVRVLCDPAASVVLNGAQGTEVWYRLSSGWARAWKTPVRTLPDFWTEPAVSDGALYINSNSVLTKYIHSSSGGGGKPPIVIGP